jgi:hypothetical protein
MSKKLIVCVLAHISVLIFLYCHLLRVYEPGKANLMGLVILLACLMHYSPLLFNRGCDEENTMIKNLLKINKMKD